jgi:branched-chain amino acid transport system permease protein
MRALPGWAFTLLCIVCAAAVFAGARWAGNDYVFFAGYTVVQFVVLATAWNILGGYTGYVNFGSAAFFALGAYSTVFFHKFEPLPIPVLLVIGAAVSGLVGLGTGYLTLRLRGAFFAIATLALAVVLETLVVNWNYVGGSRGAYVIRPAEVAYIGLPYIQYLFLIMLGVAVLAIATARGIERSKLGHGFATIRDDELAAEASGVPTLKLKLIATTLSGALMGMAGAPFPYYIGYLQPTSAFALDYAVNSIAMPMIGGTTAWMGPLIGAIVLGALEQLTTVTISSAVNLLIVGALLVGFVIIAPNGSVGLAKDFLREAAPTRTDARAVAIIAVAAYCFLAGILVVVFGLALAMQVERASILLGSAGVVFAALYFAAAYGLLTFRRWSPGLAAAVLAISAALMAGDLWYGSKEGYRAAEIALIAAAFAAVPFLLSQSVRTLYRGHKLALAAP